MDKTLETEIKLLISKKDLKKLLTMSWFKEKIIADSKEIQKLVTSYYDTEDYRLAGAGIAYRIRCNGKNCEATVKIEESSNGGVSARHEYNVSLKKAIPSLEGFAKQGLKIDLQEIVEGQELQKLFAVEVRREVYLLQITKATVVEMAIDQGKVTAGKERDKIDEVEFELKKGYKGDLLAFVAQVATKVPIYVETRSKFARGLALLGNDEECRALKKKAKVNRKGLVQEELKKIFIYYGDQVLHLQNELLNNDKKRLEADKILLPKIKRQQALLTLVQPLLLKEDYELMHNLLSEVEQPLMELYRVKRLLLQWESLYGRTGNWLQRPILSEKLTVRLEEILAHVAAQLENGTYSKCIFQLWSWLENSEWQNSDYVQVDQLTACRVEDWYNKLKELSPKGDYFSEEQLKALFFLTETMVYARRSLKMERLNKDNWLKVKELYKRLQTLIFDSYNNKGLLGLLKGNGGRGLYRDSGLLLGWRLQATRLAELKAHRMYEKVLTGLRKKE